MEELPERTFANESPHSTHIRQATGGGPANLLVVNTDKVKEWLPAIALAVAIGALIFAWASHTEGRLAQYNLADHIANQYGPTVSDVNTLKGQVSELQQRITIRQECRK